MTLAHLGVAFLVLLALGFVWFLIACRFFYGDVPCRIGWHDWPHPGFRTYGPSRCTGCGKERYQ